MRLFIDIETVPTRRSDVIEQLAAAIKPPANYSKPETIAKWEAEQKPDLVDEAHRKTALNGLLGEIAVIAWAFEDGEVRSFHRDPRLHDEFENEMLASFWGELRGKRITQWVGHNISGFDLRFLYQRSIVNKVEPSVHVPVDSPAWKSEVFDTMLAWAGYRGTVSLENLCGALGVPSPKNGIDGSKVFDAICEGRIEEVAAYCRADVAATREVYRRLTWTVVP